MIGNQVATVNIDTVRATNNFASHYESFRELKHGVTSRKVPSRMANSN
jgi:hypothetical protein